jgi:hypothetical protein
MIYIVIHRFVTKGIIYNKKGCQESPVATYTSWKLIINFTDKGMLSRIAVYSLYVLQVCDHIDKGRVLRVAVCSLYLLEAYDEFYRQRKVIINRCLQLVHLGRSQSILFSIVKWGSNYRERLMRKIMSGYVANSKNEGVGIRESGAN